MEEPGGGSGTSNSGLRDGWVGRKEDMEGRTEVWEQTGRGEGLREWGRGKETMGGLWDGSNNYT